MVNELVQYTMSDMQVMANAFAKSNLFGVKTADQAITLMLISQAEGRHPALAAKDYDIIQGKPAKKSDAMLRDYLASGGKVEWHSLDDKCASATFSHPQGGSVKIEWDMDRAKKAGLGGKDMWSKYPRQMLRARVVSEGIRTVCPAATSGFYVPEEVKDFDEKPMKDVTPAKEPVVHPIDELMANTEAAAQQAAYQGSTSLVAFLKGTEASIKAKLLAKMGAELKRMAQEADAEEEDAPASIASTALPEGETMPAFLARGAA